MLTFLSLSVGVITLLAFLIMRRFRYWERKNVPTGKVITYFGDNYDLYMGRISPVDLLLKMYNKVPPDHRYVGAYLFHVPVLIPRTSEIIKQICVKDSEHFKVHGNIHLNFADELWQEVLYPQKGQEWKEARQVLSPILNGNKVKSMFPLVGRHVEKLVEFIQKKNQEVVEIDAKDCILRILNDVACDIALSLEADSFKDPNNSFFKVGLKTCKKSRPFKKIVLKLHTLWETILKLFSGTLFGEEQSFFMTAVRETVKLREEFQIKKHDFMGILMETRAEQLTARAEAGEDGKDMKVVTEGDMASYMFLMYLGVMDSATTILSFLVWELAVNPGIQERLRKECDETPSEDVEATYQDIIDMKYMDMVISEVLRKWPGAIATDRVVTKPYTILPELPHEKPVHLDVGDNILLPIYAIHRDPKYYENPDDFDPERFSPENKHKIQPNAFIPFGVGPRFCVATRFSMLVMKVIGYQLIRSFEIVPVEKTTNPLLMDKEALSFYPVGGFPLGFKERKRRINPLHG